jgi:hypothetical protein
MTEEDPPHDFKELLRRLEIIKKDGTGTYSLTKADYALAMEILEMKKRIDYLENKVLEMQCDINDISK